MSPVKQAFALAGFIALSLLAGAVGSLAEPGAWYDALRKPSWNPPSWVFGPVWTALYIAMGTAAWLVWRAPRPAGRALAFFGAQLVLNALWSLIFFGLRRPGLALVEIVVLWFAILATLLAFARISRPAAILFVPYLAWVTFATALNASIWWLNRG